MKKKKPNNQKVIEENTEKLRECIEYVCGNIGYLKYLEKWELYGLQHLFNNSGFSLVETKSLANLYTLQDFCNANQLNVINHAF